MAGEVWAVSQSSCPLQRRATWSLQDREESGAGGLRPMWPMAFLLQIFIPCIDKPVTQIGVGYLLEAQALIHAVALLTFKG